MEILYVRDWLAEKNNTPIETQKAQFAWFRKWRSVIRYSDRKMFIVGRKVNVNNKADIVYTIHGFDDNMIHVKLKHEQDAHFCSINKLDFIKK